MGCAPDTFLGAGIQTCRKLIDDGWIGEPIAASAFMTNHGHESWHPDPEFYYQLGGGPMLDMGPYYLTALVNLMGPVVQRNRLRPRHLRPAHHHQRSPSTARSSTSRCPRMCMGVLDFANGAIGNVLTTFDVWSASLPFIEIYGTAGHAERAGPQYVRRPGQSAPVL